MAGRHGRSTGAGFHALKCPLCGKEMTKMSESAADSSEPVRREGIYYCERHGVMNKGSDLKEKADQMARRA